MGGSAAHARATVARQACLDACLACARACEAVVASARAAALPETYRAAIEAGLSCADICVATARKIGRARASDALTDALVATCLIAAEACLGAVSAHPESADCLACAAACRGCIDACRRVRALPKRR